MLGPNTSSAELTRSSGMAIFPMVPPATSIPLLP